MTKAKYRCKGKNKSDLWIVWKWVDGKYNRPSLWDHIHSQRLDLLSVAAWLSYHSYGNMVACGRWLDYSNVGKTIEGTPIVALKVPLREVRFRRFLLGTWWLSHTRQKVCTLSLRPNNIFTYRLRIFVYIFIFRYSYIRVPQYIFMYHGSGGTYSIAYRCDDEKKKTLELGWHLGIIAQLKTPTFRKCRSLTLSKHLFIRELEKTTLHGLSIPNPNFSEFACFGK